MSSHCVLDKYTRVHGHGPKSILCLPRGERPTNQPIGITFCRQLSKAAERDQCCIHSDPTPHHQSTSASHSLPFPPFSAPKRLLAESQTWRYAVLICMHCCAWLTVYRQSHLSTPDLSSRACTSRLLQEAHLHCDLPETRTDPSQSRQGHCCSVKVGRDRVQGQTGFGRPVHEHPVVQHGRVRKRRQLRHARTSAYTVQQRALDWQGRRGGTKDW